MLSLSFLTSGHPVTLQSLLCLAELPNAWGPSDPGQVWGHHKDHLYVFNLPHL